MKHNNKYQVIIVLLLIVMIGTSFTQVSSSKNLSFINKQGEIPIDGQILFSPLYGTTTYLIDSMGAVNHTWSSSYTPGAAVYWLGDGTILRTIRTVISGGGSGGGIQKVNRGTSRSNTSGVVGVSWEKNQGKWRARVEVENKKKHLGMFTCKIEAARAVNEKWIELGWSEKGRKLNDLEAIECDCDKYKLQIDKITE